MKTYLRILFSILPLITFTYGYSQETVGYAITENDERIDFYQNVQEKSKIAYDHVLDGDVSMTGEYLFYFDRNNNFEKIAQKKIKELSYGRRRFLTLPINWTMERIHEVIAENEKYLLTQYYFNGVNFFYVFDKNNMKYVEKKISHSYKAKKDAKSLKKYIKPYFSDCPGLLKKLEYNIENIPYRRNSAYRDYSGYASNFLFNEISNFKCQ